MRAESFSKTRLWITLLLILEICLGLIIIIVTAIYQSSLAIYMGDMERKILNGQFFSIYILALQIIATYTVSISIWKRIFKQLQVKASSTYAQPLLSMWMFFSFLIVCCGCGTIWSLYSCVDFLEHSAEISLQQGINAYYSCPDWKLLWDELQYRKQCCGVHNYKDWMQAPWMPSASEMKKAFSGDTEELHKSCATENEIIVAPYACCKHTCQNCFEHYESVLSNSADSKNGVDFDMPYLNMSHINTQGCLPMFSKTIHQVIYILLLLVFIAFKVDLLICALAKYMFRSKLNSTSDYSNAGFDNDASNKATVYVKCPQNVRCITINGDIDDGDAQWHERISIASLAEEPQENCNDFEKNEHIYAELQQHIAVTQELVEEQIPLKSNRRSHNCDCVYSPASRILH